MTHEKRQAVRLPCTLPLRIKGVEGMVQATLVDISRIGLRLRIPGEALRVHRLSSLVQISRRLHGVLGDSFGAEIQVGDQGVVVRRWLTMTRIAKRDWERTDVEVGCSLSEVLTDEEAQILGVALPQFGVTAETPPEPVDAAPMGAGILDELCAEEPPADPMEPPAHPMEEGVYQAFIYPAPGKTSQPLLTRTESLSPGNAILRVEKMQGWNYENLDVGQLVAALDEAYGTDILLRIVEGDHDLWAGPAEIKDVDVTPDPAGIRIGVSFGRELRTEELDRLGLPTPA